MIRSYGLHWKAAGVDWGHQNRKGTLLGAASRSSRAHPVDFREQRGIYALYAEFDLLYVGQIGAGDDRLFKRLRCHRGDHLAERWDRFSWFGLLGVTKQRELSSDTLNVEVEVSRALNILEAVTIAVSEPRLNLQRGRWGDATQYFQFTADQEEEEEV